MTLGAIERHFSARDVIFKDIIIMGINILCCFLLELSQTVKVEEDFMCLISCDALEGL